MTSPVESLLTEIASGLSDLVGAIEKAQEKGANPGLLEAISKLSIKPPDVRVSVPAATAPTVSVMPSDWTSLRIKVSKAAADGSKEFVITKERK